jgi:hypothetical protein
MRLRLQAKAEGLERAASLGPPSRTLRVTAFGWTRAPPSDVEVKEAPATASAQ